MADLVLLSNFAHDFGAAGWLFCSIFLAVAWRKKLVSDSPKELFKLVMSLMRISGAAVIVFGIVRTLTYRQFEWSEAAGDSQITVLIVKHIFFTIVFVWGLCFYVKTSRFLRKQ